MRLAAMVVATLAAITWTGLVAHAAESVDTYTVEAKVLLDGTVSVKALITFAGAAPESVQQRFATTANTTDARQYRFQVVDVKASSAGSDLGAKVSSGAKDTTVVIPTAGVSGTVELDYVVHGAAIRAANGDTIVAWPFLQGLSLPVATFDATVLVPAMFTQIDCAAGAAESPGACTYYGGGTDVHPQPYFHDEGRAAGEVVVATIRFPAGSIPVNEDLRDLWTFERAFSAKPLPLSIALAVLALGGLALWMAHRKAGRDAAASVNPTRIAEFHPVADGRSEFRVLDAVRPGMVGTVMDEHVDPVDVTATLLDLAVRGHLRIEELPRESAHAGTEWTFVRRDAVDDIADYEQILLDAVAPVQGEPVKVANLVGSIGSVIGQVQSELYDEVVKRGWFARRPDSTRNTWARLGWVALAGAVVATVLLAAWSSFGLTGLALVALALGVVFVAQEMPARTASGASLLGGLQILRGVLQTQPTDQLPTGRTLEQLSRILPYAVVLGGYDRWLQALVDADTDDDTDSTDLDWYHAPQGWHLSDLPHSLRNFVTTVQGTLFSR